jgi:hypothetical protein
LLAGRVRLDVNTLLSALSDVREQLRITTERRRQTRNSGPVSLPIVDFKAAETGSFVSYGTNHPMDESLTPFVSQYVFRFDDLSSISVTTARNFDPASQVAKASGEILSGTGRFEGITGKVNLVSRFSGLNPQMDWTGSYSLRRTRVQ